MFWTFRRFAAGAELDFAHFWQLLTLRRSARREPFWNDDDDHDDDVAVDVKANDTGRCAITIIFCFSSF